VNASRWYCIGLLWLYCAHAMAGARPIERIVSLAPHLTELAFEAGAGPRVVGTVEYSDEPAPAREIPRIGDAFRIDVERVLALRPDVILAWSTGTPQQTTRRLRSLGLRVEEFDTQRLADIPAVVRALGRLAGTTQIASAHAARFDREIDALRVQYRERAPVRVFLQVNSRPLYTVNGSQLMSELIELCGARNIFDDLNQLAAQVSVEAVIERNPEAIISTDDGDSKSLDTWRKWSHLEAVRTDNLYQLPGNDLTRATTRLAQGAGMLCRVLDTARVRAARARP